jgi:hypothetical protein
VHYFGWEVCVVLQELPVLCRLRAGSTVCQSSLNPVVVGFKCRRCFNDFGLASFEYQVLYLDSIANYTGILIRVSVFSRETDTWWPGCAVPQSRRWMPAIGSLTRRK